jgi:hypothetical protein
MPETFFEAKKLRFTDVELVEGGQTLNFSIQKSSFSAPFAALFPWF